MRRKKVTYPVARTSRQPGGPRTQADARERAGLVAINLNAREGQKGLTIGTRVRIGGDGLYAGESAVVTALSQGVIPSAMIRTEAGGTRRIRTIDLELIRADD